MIYNIIVPLDCLQSLRASHQKTLASGRISLGRIGMAKNRVPENDPEPESESGSEGEEEEEEASSEEIGSSDSESEESQPQVAKTPSIAPAPQKPNSSSSLKPKSSSSEESETESEYESESDQPDSVVNPFASRPMAIGDVPDSATRKLKFQPTASMPASPTKTAATKRPAMDKETDSKDSKKSKTKHEVEAETSEKKSSDDSKKQLFQRLWSEDDEIVVLKGMIEYLTKKKADPGADLNAFHDFIRKDLHVDVNRSQLQDKIRRLKKKYENNKSKEKDGKDRTFTKSHERKAYELSKKIWGNANGDDVEKVIAIPTANGSAVKKTPSKKGKVESGDSKEVKIQGIVNSNVDMPASGSVRFHDGNFEDWILKTGLQLMDEEKRVEMEREWEKLRAEETVLYLKKLEFLQSHTKRVLQFFNSSEP